MKYHYRMLMIPTSTQSARWEIWHIQTQKLIATCRSRREARELKAQLEQRMQTAMNAPEANDAHASP